MRSIRRFSLSAAALALLLLAPRPAAAQPEPDDSGPCQVFCDALHALCVFLGGGGLCKHMRDGCNFGCSLKVL